MRIGQGFDIHPFSQDPSRKLVLGGVVIEGAQALSGHSDADVVAHALADAVLGAAGLGDLGAHFPDTDPKWAGADSIELLTQVVALAADAGLYPVNADCTVIAQVPKLSPHISDIARRLHEVLDAPTSVKATSGEGLGAIGRSEGIACLAVVLLDSPPDRGDVHNRPVNPPEGS